VLFLPTFMLALSPINEFHGPQEDHRVQVAPVKPPVIATCIGGRPDHRFEEGDVQPSRDGPVEVMERTVFLCISHALRCGLLPVDELSVHADVLDIPEVSGNLQIRVIETDIRHEHRTVAVAQEILSVSRLEIKISRRRVGYISKGVPVIIGILFKDFIPSLSGDDPLLLVHRIDVGDELDLVLKVAGREGDLVHDGPLHQEPSGVLPCGSAVGKVVARPEVKEEVDVEVHPLLFQDQEILVEGFVPDPVDRFLLVAPVDPHIPKEAVGGDHRIDLRKHQRPDRGVKAIGRRINIPVVREIQRRVVPRIVLRISGIRHPASQCEDEHQQFKRFPHASGFYVSF
jgi:hypothetical protein